MMEDLTLLSGSQFEFPATGEPMRALATGHVTTSGQWELNTSGALQDAARGSRAARQTTPGLQRRHIGACMTSREGAAISSSWDWTWTFMGIKTRQEAIGLKLELDREPAPVELVVVGVRPC